MTDHLPRRMKIYAVGVERRTGKNAGTLKVHVCSHPGDAEAKAARLRSLGYDPLLFVATVAGWEQIDEVPVTPQRRARLAPPAGRC